MGRCRAKKHSRERLPGEQKLPCFYPAQLEAYELPTQGLKSDTETIEGTALLILERKGRTHKRLAILLSHTHSQRSICSFPLTNLLHFTLATLQKSSRGRKHMTHHDMFVYRVSALRKVTLISSEEASRQTQLHAEPCVVGRAAFPSPSAALRH